MPYPINDILFQPFSILIVFFPSFFLVITSAITWSFKDKIKFSLCASFKICSFAVGRASAASRRP